MGTIALIRDTCTTLMIDVADVHFVGLNEQTMYRRATYT
jgi:hypothetical protein